MTSRGAFSQAALVIAALPSAARAQQEGRIPRIGVLWHAGNAEEESPYLESLIEGFRALGYTGGRIALEHRYPNELPELFTSMAAELVAAKPDVLVAVGGAAPYLKRATSTIPVVFMYVPDPIGAKLVDSIRRPGANVTGLTNFSVEISAKRLQLVKEMVPRVSRVALLVNPNAKISDLYIALAAEAAPKLGLTTQPFEARSGAELERAFDAMVKARMQAVVVNAEGLFYQKKDQNAKLAETHKLPSCVWVREVLESGALFSYGVDQRAIARRVAVYVDRILKGVKPADMPVEQPTTFELVVNMKIAKLLGIKVPQSILIQATAVIE